MKKNAIYIVVASSLMILFCLVYQTTYSYFAVGHNDTRGEKKYANVTAADLQDLTLISGNTNESNLLIPGESLNSTFSVNNPSSATLCFKLKWHDVTNTFINKNDLKVTLIDSKNNVLANTIFPSFDNTPLADSVYITANTTEEYTIAVTYQNTNENQNSDMGKMFSGKLSGELTVCSTK